MCGTAVGRLPADFSVIELKEFAIDLLEELNRSQNVLADRISRLEKMVSQSSHASSSNYFPQFMRLPPEIRHRIWALCIQIRAFRPWNPLGSGSEHKDRHGLLPPSVAHACRESRAVACRRGNMFSLRYDIGPSGHSAAATTTTRWTWFDGANDVLDLERWVSLEKDEPRGISRLAEKAEVILAPRIHSGWFMHLFCNSPLLKRIDLKLDTCQVNRSCWHPKMTDQVFGTNTIRIVDLEDALDIRLAMALMEDNWRPLFPHLDLAGWAATRPHRSKMKRDKAWLSRIEDTWMGEISQGWLSAKQRALPQSHDLAELGKSNNSGGLVDLENQAARDTLLSLPEMRLVRVYHLVESHVENSKK